MQRSNGNTAEQASRRFVVYGLIDPRDGSVRYIGATRNLRQRLTSHRGPTDYGSGETRKAWFSDLRASGRWPFAAVILQEVATLEELPDAEWAWIRRGIESGWPLTNTLGVEVPASEVHAVGRMARIRARRALRLERAGLSASTPEAA